MTTMLDLMKSFDRNSERADSIAPRSSVGGVRPPTTKRTGVYLGWRHKGPRLYKQGIERWRSFEDISTQEVAKDLADIAGQLASLKGEAHPWLRGPNYHTLCTLIHNADARAMLSEMTRRRDAFVAAEGSMPSQHPSE